MKKLAIATLLLGLPFGIPLALLVIAYRRYVRYRGERELARTLDLLRTHSHVCAATEERV